MVRIPVSPVGLEDAVEGSWVCITGESFPPRGAWVMGCHGAVALSSEGRAGRRVKEVEPELDLLSQEVYWAGAQEHQRELPQGSLKSTQQLTGRGTTRTG